MSKIKFLSFIFLLIVSSSIFAQKTYEINAVNVLPKQKNVIAMSGQNPQGTRLSVNSLYFEKDGKPWFPLMGEMHYNRVPQALWEEEILKIKSAGLSIIATYVFWNEHETAKGIWDWKGNRDLRRFIDLCAKNGMYVWLRIGPWSHGEQLYGGFPQWIQDMKGHRSNNPAYMAEAKKLYYQISQQAKGMYFKDGGPVIGVQLENEYAAGQAEHITALKRMAQELDIDPVFWTVTANTVFDENKMEVIPLQGSYSYRGWEKGGGGPTKDFLYGNDQWIMTDALGKLYYDIDRFPRGMCEQGCGSQMTYNNRFIVEPHIVEAHVQNQIGRGMNLVGYYMFHGGTQTPGLKEPGCPESYDFQAPVGEFGFLHPSYRYLKILHQFINDFGSELAQMQVVPAPNPVTDELNTTDLRYIARINSDNSGYLFLNNSQVRVPMPDKNVQLKVRLKDEIIEFPAMNIKGETSPVFPFNFKTNGVSFKYITAQPFARLSNNGVETVFFLQPEGVPTELAIDKSTLGKIIIGGITKNESRKMMKISLKENQNLLRFTSKNGKQTELVFISRKDAENAWKITNNDKEMLLITAADVIDDNGQIELRQIDNAAFTCYAYPQDAFGKSYAAAKINISDKIGFTRYDFSVKPVILPVRMEVNNNKAIVENFSALPENMSDIVLKIDYLGGECIIKSGNTILTDNLFNGDESGWLVGLKRYKNLPSIQFEAKEWSDNITGVSPEKVKEAKEKDPVIKDIQVMPQYRCFITLTAMAQTRDTVYVSDFGAHPYSYENSVEEIQAAIDECKRTGAKVLVFEKGRYDIWPEGATRREYFVSNTSSETEAPSKIKTIGMMLDNIHGLTMEGNGATLVYHGKMTTVVMDNCKNIHLKNLRIDFQRPAVSELTYTRVDKGEVEVSVHPDTWYQIVEGKVHLFGEGWRSNKNHCTEYHPQKEIFTYSQGWNVLENSPATEITRNHIRFKTPESFQPEAGNTITVRDIIRDQSGMLILESKDITFSDIFMHSMGGIGIMSQYTENITMHRVICAPPENSGRLMVSSADMMHFSGCRGKIIIDECYFSGGQDDPVNVHGTNLRIMEKTGERSLKLRFMHHQSYGFNVFFPGDQVAFVNASTMLRYATANVVSVRKISDREVEAVLDKPLPPELEFNHDCLENLSYTPELEVRNSYFTHTNTRGLLVTTPRKVVIENNIFYKTGMSAILIEGDAEGWYESGTVKDVLIKNNTFVDCGANGGPGNAVIAIHPSNTVIDANRPVHRNIRIEDNVFKTFDYPVLYAKSTGGLIFKDNTIERTNTLPAVSKNQYTFYLNGCKDVLIENTKYEGDVLGRNIKTENMKESFLKKR